MNFSWWTFALQAANFLVLVWLLQRFLFKPVKTIVAQRKAEISRALSEAAAEKDRAERLKQETTAERSGIGAERQKMIDDERALLSAEREKMLEEVRSETEKIRSQALKRLDEERTAAGNELFERTIALATELAERLLRETAGPSMERPFLGRVIDYLDRLPAAERARLLSQSSNGALMVTTAHPLDIQQQSEWRDQLAQRLSTGLSVKFGADPTLIAGVEVTFPHAVLRFNWRDTVATALIELQKNEPPR